MIQFFAPDIETNNILPEGESAHCARVLRFSSGDEITVTDGKGNRYKCIIEKAHPSHTTVSIISKEFIPDIRNYKLTLAVAPTKNSERMEWMVEKAVEIGVNKIVLLKCDRSERKFQRGERLQKIMVSALKQSLESRLPVLEEMVDFETFVKNNSLGCNKFFGYCSPDYPRKEFVKECKPGKDVIVMIGPEGDFTEQEVENAVENGFIPVTFGEKRLRTETAGVFVVSAVNVINQMSD